jgi:hypothetical protein
MDKFYEWCDDKTQVIIVVAALSAMALVMLGPEALSMIDNAIAGLFGVAVGKALSK